VNSKPKVVAPGSAKTLNILGDMTTSILSAADTNGAYSLAIQANRPGSGPPLHRHTREDESFFILEGEYEIRLGDQSVHAVAGAYVFGPRGVAHTFKCVGARPGRIQVIVSPPNLEGFFEGIDSLARSGPVAPERVAALAAEYGIELLGPPSGS
jgi:mannose-6-phosphate isomerase-like protein (cupin superfamily)